MINFPKLRKNPGTRKPVSQRRPSVFQQRNIKTVWGLDIGDNALKAVKITRKNNDVIVDDVDIIEYPAPLSSTKLLESHHVRNTIQTFLSKHAFNKKIDIVASVPGQLAMSRFSTIPPVNKRQLRNLVNYEAQQQIPFELKDVVWDYHQLSGRVPSEEGIEIGFFASKRETLHSIINNISFREFNLTALLTSPLAIYNLVLFDQQVEGPTIIVHIEEENTDLIIIDHSHFWLRTIPLREVNADFVKEIQRSMEYYKSLSKDTDTVHFEKLLLIGNKFNDPLMQNTIKDNFAYKVEVLNTLNNIRISGNIDHAFFSGNCVSLSVALGLALQGVGLGKTAVNLLPKELVRAAQVSKIKPYAIAGLGCFALLIVAQYFGLRFHISKLNNAHNYHQAILQNVKNLESTYKKTEKTFNEKKSELELISSIDSSRFFWIEAIEKLLESIPGNVSINSLQSSWIDPDTLNINEGKAKKNQKDDNTAKKCLFIGIKGESREPGIRFIEENVLQPIKELTLFGQKVAAFKNVELVPNSCRQVYSEADTTECISFEIRWIVKSQEEIIAESEKIDLQEEKNISNGI
ncbi:MAG: pilus assembly protein PilM [Candidatus Kuenenia sp.]|nr:pilus assembly protein PilM [Candidatus Kuenenia hertensis]